MRTGAVGWAETVRQAMDNSVKSSFFIYQEFSVFREMVLEFDALEVEVIDKHPNPKDQHPENLQAPRIQICGIGA